MSIDVGTELVQAYLQMNGYFTVVDYPLVELASAHPTRSVTDVDLLAVRLSTEFVVPEKRTGKKVRGPVLSKPDPALDCPDDGTDMIVAEVKQGQARVNPASRKPAVLAAALSRFGCCDPKDSHSVVQKLLPNVQHRKILKTTEQENMMKKTSKRLYFQSRATNELSRLLRIAGLFLLLNTGALWAAQPDPHAHHTDLTVYKTEQCGCCDEWANQLEQSGLNVEIIIVNETNSVRTKLGVPQQLASCHTAVAGDYWVEGHVPVDLIKQLINDQPEKIKGIAVPGMPAGSPGMESPTPETYQVLSVDDSGNVAVVATRRGESTR